MLGIIICTDSVMLWLVLVPQVSFFCLGEWQQSASSISDNNLLKSIGLFFCPAYEGACCGRKFQGFCPVGGDAWQLFWKRVLIDLKKTGGHDAKVTFNLNVTKSSRKFRTMAWNDQYNLEFAPYHSICRLFVHFQVRIYFLAAATIEKIVWKHCNQFRSKIVVVVLWCWRCGSL